MTDAQAVGLIYQYARFARNNNLPTIMSEISKRYAALANPSTEKAMRWLGFCQGYLVATNCMSLEQVKAHSANPDRDIDLPWFHKQPGIYENMTYAERYAASALNNQGDYILPGNGEAA